MANHTTPEPQQAAAPSTQTVAPEPAEPAAPEADLQGSAGNAALAGLAEEGGLRINLGGGIQLSASDLEGRGRGREVTVDLSQRRPQPVPGLQLKNFVYNVARRSGTLEADLDIPRVNNVRGGLRIRVNNRGEVRFRGHVRATTDLGALNNPSLAIGIDEDKNLSGTITVEPSDLTPRALRRRLSVAGGGTVTLSNGKLSGAVEATLTYNGLGTGRINLNFAETGELSGGGNLEVTQPYLQGVRADLTVQEGNLAADVNVPASSIRSPIQGLEIPEGNIHLTYQNHTPGGALENLTLRYPGLGQGVINADIRSGLFSGGGSFNVTISQLTDVSGQIQYRGGRLTGTATIRSGDFPEALPVRSGSITATLNADGSVAFQGEVTVTLGPAGSGQLRAGYRDNQVNIGCTIDLNVPGLEGARFSIDYVNGNLEGEGDVPIDAELLQGISGAVHVAYREGLWSGNTELTYDADDGKLHGTVRVGVQQNEQGGLNVYGGGEVTAQLAPRLQGTLGVNIQPDGTVDISGAITVTEPLELFPEWRADRELFRYSQNIPLWAILVAVIRVRAGVRAGVGPGEFRDIRVEGDYTIGGDEEPSFSITGEMYIPAFVEAYVAFGAGLGLDVVLGSLTGGIEGVATAGIYGAVSVVPELAYENGDYKIEGTATLAAGARLKVGLNAWAEVEALWVTVWEQTWELAEWVWSVGPDLALQARMSYVFGHPEPPSIEFNTTDIDSDRLIRDAMPKDGPGPSGAREALQNRAEWRGALQRQGREAGRVPGDLQQQAAQPAQAPAAPARPQRPTPPQGAQAQDTAAQGQAGTPQADTRREARQQREAAQPPTGGQHASPAAEVPGADQPRYPRPVTLVTLDEPPAATPRTAQQQREDVEAAARCVRLASDQARSTEELASYFTRIKTRFGLSTIGFHDMGRGRLAVRCTINPTVDRPVSEPLQGTGIAEAGVVLRTDISFQSGQLGGDTVGMAMEARKLGPDHPQGSGPGNSQPTLMGKLVTDPGQSGDSRYIRGHLLNDNLGGPGRDVNLFPITSQANNLHAARVENQLKRLVNDQRYWVYYKVNVVVHDVLLTDPDRSKNKVNADFVCEAYVLTTDGSHSNQRLNATITSRYREPATAPEAAELTPGFAPRAADLAAPAPLLSSRVGERSYRLDDRIYGALQSARTSAGWRQVDAALLNIRGIGPAKLNVLHKAYANAMRNGNTDQGSLLADDERRGLSNLNGMAQEIESALRALA